MSTLLLREEATKIEVGVNFEDIVNTEECVSPQGAVNRQDTANREDGANTADIVKKKLSESRTRNELRRCIKCVSRLTVVFNAIPTTSTLAWPDILPG